MCACILMISDTYSPFFARRFHFRCCAQSCERAEGTSLLEIVHIEGACMSWLVWVTVRRMRWTRTSEHIGISPAEEVWTVSNDNETYLVAALTCSVLQQAHRTSSASFLTLPVQQQKDKYWVTRYRPHNQKNREACLSLQMLLRYLAPNAFQSFSIKVASSLAHSGSLGWPVSST
jgi:hypothetical protein